MNWIRRPVSKASGNTGVKNLAAQWTVGQRRSARFSWQVSVGQWQLKQRKQARKVHITRNTEMRGQGAYEPLDESTIDCNTACP